MRLPIIYVLTPNTTCMRAASTGSQHLLADAAYTVLLDADLHLHEHTAEPSKRQRLRERIVPGRLEDYAARYGCDAVYVDGDVGDDLRDVVSVLSADIDYMRLVWGDEDEDWYRHVTETGELDREKTDAALQEIYGDRLDAVGRTVADHVCGETLSWTVHTDETGSGFDVMMVHDPADVDLKPVLNGETQLLPDTVAETDITIYAHHHRPAVDVVDGTILIGSGSPFSIYTDTEPGRSVFVLGFDPGTVHVGLIDLDAVDMEDAKNGDPAAVAREELVSYWKIQYDDGFATC